MDQFIGNSQIDGFLYSINSRAALSSITWSDTGVWMDQVLVCLVFILGTAWLILFLWNLLIGDSLPYELYGVLTAFWLLKAIKVSIFNRPDSQLQNFKRFSLLSLLEIWVLVFEISNPIFVIHFSIQAWKNVGYKGIGPRTEWPIYSLGLPDVNVVSLMDL